MSMPDINQMLVDADQWKTRTQALQPSTKPWYTITNGLSDVATVRIYDEIGGWGVEAEAFASDLQGITATEIEVHINSPGGSVFDGLAIYNSLRTHPARIVTRVDGLAASAASFIAQAGDERVMVEASQMMIHDARAIAAGTAEDFRAAADFLEKQSANMAGLYAARAEMNDADHYAQLMSAETWFTAAEAVAEGLADRVLVPERQTSNTGAKFSPPAAINDAAATAAAELDAALVESSHGERSAYLRSLTLPQRK